MPEVVETSQPPDIRNWSESLHSAFQSLTVFKIEALQKKLRNVHLYNVADENFFKTDALKNYELRAAGVLMLLTELSEFAGAFLQLQISNVPERSTTFLVAEGNLVGEVAVLEN